MTPKEVLGFASKYGAKMVDFKFVDVPGTWQHFSVPARTLSEDLFSEGIGFDGSSIRGFQEINESDMLLMPDPATAIMDPFTAEPTLSLVCNVVEPGTLKPYSRDPRYIAQKAEAYLSKSGLADVSFWGPEAEFFIFDSVRFVSNGHQQIAEVDSEEGHWNSGRSGGAANLGYHVRPKEGYFPVAPLDTFQDLRTQMVLTLEAAGIEVEAQHHEVATAGQSEIDMRFDSLVRMADKLLLYKYIIKNVAARAGKTVTFMPKPIFGDNGSGMHIHQSLWKGERPLFAEKSGYAGLSEMALHYIGGILTHAPAILALAAPTTNSYKRLVPGYEAPVNLVFSQRNRSAAVRIPMYSDNPKAKRIEFRPPDPTCNPYLTFSALLMAGLDGIRRKIVPSENGFGPMDRNIYEMTAFEKREIRSVPGSLDESLDALESDHAFLLEGEVFTQDLLEKYIEMKRAVSAEIRLRPSPIEFFHFFDA
jgi:glutamine synthetase